MTIVTGTTRASTLAAAGQENNPFLTPAPFTGIYTTETGTELEIAGNAASGLTNDPWIATPDSGQARWQVALTSSEAVTFVGIAAHNLADVGATVRLQYSDDSGATWTNADTAAVTPTDNQSIGFRIDGVTTNYWAINITGATGNVSVAVIMVCQEIIIPQRIYQGYTPPITPNQVDMNSNVSEGQNLLGSMSKQRGSTWQTEIQHLEPTFLRGATWQAFQRRWNEGFGAFWAWRPTKYGDLFYSWRQGGIIQPTNSGPNELMSFSVSGRAYHE